MEKLSGVSQQQQQQQEEGAVKCPRCDSANTKFCYYNNYSLSQPRHLCKACKRYWTRGGTLRNVPVGGGCRKNKHHQRLKRSSTTIIDSTTSPSSSSSSQSHHHHYHHHHNINPLFYGLANNNPALDVNLVPFSSSTISSCSGLFDLLHPQMNALGLGFSSGVMPSTDNGFIRNNNNEFSSSSSNSNNMVFPLDMMPSNNSVLGSTLMMMQQQQQQQNKLMMNNNGVKDDGPAGHQNKTTAFDVQSGVVGAASKDVKVELGHSRLLQLWNNNNNNNNGNNGASGTASSTVTAANCQNQIQIQNHVNVITYSDPNSLYWNSPAAAEAALGSSSGGVNWNDQPNNIAPSLTSLI